QTWKPLSECPGDRGDGEMGEGRRSKLRLHEFHYGDYFAGKRLKPTRRIGWWQSDGCFGQRVHTAAAGWRGGHQGRNGWLRLESLFESAIGTDIHGQVSMLGMRSLIIAEVETGNSNWRRGTAFGDAPVAVRFIRDHIAGCN